VLPASNRLRLGQDFSKTTKTGHRATSNLLVLYFLTHEQLPLAPQVGLIINKSVGGSVTRHRIARQLRHAMASHLKDLPAHTQIVIRALKNNPDYREDLSQLITKAIKRTGAHQ
jgi:ribonuclease P protein component